MCIVRRATSRLALRIEMTESSMTNRSVINERISETVQVSEPLSGLVLSSMKDDYPLDEAEFIRLTTKGNTVISWAANLLFVTLGYALSLGPTLLSGPTEGISQPSSAELEVLFWAFAMTAAVFVIGLIVPNEKKRLIKRMRKHFENSPKTKHLRRHGE